MHRSRSVCTIRLHQTWYNYTIRFGIEEVRDILRIAVGEGISVNSDRHASHLAEPRKAIDPRRGHHCWSYVLSAI